VRHLGRMHLEVDMVAAEGTSASFQSSPELRL
jgi:hypothetical protein